VKYLTVFIIIFPAVYYSF